MMQREIRMARLEEYLIQLEAALIGVPESERADILMETRSHVLDRSRRSHTDVDTVLAELGPPASYAEQFRSDPPQKLSPTIEGIARLATGGIRTIPLLIAVAAGYAIASFALFIALLKLKEPEATGWYVTQHAGGGVTRGLVLSDPRVGGEELLGYWLVLISLAVCLTLHFAMSALLRRYVFRARGTSLP